jgi:hypothetical protein
MNTRRLQEMCIPRIDTGVHKEYIETVLTKLNIGKIINIRETPLFTDTQYKKVIIQIEWNTNTNTKTTQRIYDRLNEGKSINLVYSESEPWFWKIFLKRQTLKT